MNKFLKSIRISSNLIVGNPDTHFSTWGQPYPNCNHPTNGDSQTVQKMAIQFKVKQNKTKQNDDTKKTENKQKYGLFLCKKKPGYQGGALLNTFFIKVSPGEPKDQKSIKTRLSTTKQRCRVTLQVSKPQSQKTRTSGQSTWENRYQKNTKQLLSRWARARQIPMGRSAKHLENTSKQSLKQCNKAADSWPTTAWKHRLGALEAGGGPGLQTATQASQRPPLWEEAQTLAADPTELPGPWGRDRQHQHAKTHGCKKSHRSPAHSGSGH